MTLFEIEFEIKNGGRLNPKIAKILEQELKLKNKVLIKENVAILDITRKIIDLEASIRKDVLHLFLKRPKFTIEEIT